MYTVYKEEQVEPAYNARTTLQGYQPPIASSLTPEVGFPSRPFGWGSPALLQWAGSAEDQKKYSPSHGQRAWVYVHANGFKGPSGIVWRFKLDITHKGCFSGISFLHHDIDALVVRKPLQPLRSRQV